MHAQHVVMLECLKRKVYFILSVFIRSACFVQAFEKKLQGWCSEAGEGVSYEFIQVS